MYLVKNLDQIHLFYLILLLLFIVKIGKSILMSNVYILQPLLNYQLIAINYQFIA